MTRYDFIFSKKPSLRLARHLAFWLAFSLHFIIQNLMIGGPAEARTSRSFLESTIHSMYFLPFYILSTYIFIEWLLPRFLYTRKYAAFIILFLLLFIADFTAVYYAGVLYLHQTNHLPFSQISLYANKYHALANGLFVPFMLYGIAAGIKFSKKWLIQQHENEKLAKQKLATELQLLKTSIHPRFLIHSLHTVEKNIDNASAQSPSLIIQLSDLLSYILYENDQNWVALEKELEIIRCYINLEETSFSGKLLCKSQFPENTEGKFIMPLLLLSLIESSFEYFFETAQEEPLMTLTIEIHENVLDFQILFSKPVQESTSAIVPHEKFLSLQKQLKNHYPGLHHFEISSDAESISIDLKLPLYIRELIELKKNVHLNEIPATI